MAIVNKLVDAHVVVEFQTWHTSNAEKLARELEEKARDFMAFVRDHRSMDVTDAHVVRVYELVCEHCKSTIDESEKLRPMCCEKAVREWASEEELKEYIA